MKRLIALLLALSALFSLAACGGTNAFALAEATYPESAPYPNEAKYSGAKYEAAYDAWSADRRARNTAASSVDGALDDYVRATLPALLSGADGKNAVCSPVNVYMALSMLAEVTDGDTRAQILSLLGADSMESLRKTAGNVWAANYQNDGAVTSILADSLWLSDSMDYNSNTLARLADSYYASAYRGEMGSVQRSAPPLDQRADGRPFEGQRRRSFARAGYGDCARLDHILPREVGQRVFKERHDGRRIPRAGRRRDAQIHARNHGEHVLRRR